MISESSTPVLDGLQAVPGGFGQPSFVAFYAAVVEASRQRAAEGAPPPILFLMGEPLAGKTTVLSQLFRRLTGAPLAGGEGALAGEVCRPALIRWGDAIRAAKSVGLVAPERQFGDLTPDEFGAVSRLVAETADEAAQAAAGSGPGLVVVEAPGVTAVAGPDGGPRGLDRGYTFARQLARRPDGFLMALGADRRVRETHLGSRGAAGALNVREATQLAANRIRQQVGDLLFELARAGTIQLPAPAPASPLTRESLDAHPEYRDWAVLAVFLPFLFGRDLGVPAARAFIGRNAFLGADVAPDGAILDDHDWIRARFGL